jgi:hypothetical protein
VGLRTPALPVERPALVLLNSTIYKFKCADRVMNDCYH